MKVGTNSAIPPIKIKTVAAINISVTDILTAWQGGTTNRGFALVPTGTGGVDFYTSESATAGVRPMLTVQYTVTNPNVVAFTQDPITGSNATVGSSYSGDLSPYADDPDSDPLTFSKVSGPTWLNVATNGALSGTPDVGSVGSNSFVVQVADSDDGWDTATLNIEVLPHPDAVSFTTDPISGTPARATVAYTGNISSYANDPDSDPLTFSKVAGPGWLTVASDGTLGGTPAVEDMSLNSFVVQVSDTGDGVDTATLTIQVNDPDGNNLNPSATDQIRLVWLDDPSTTMTVAWKQTSGSAATVHYGKTDHGRYPNLYANTKAIDVARTYNRSGTIVTQFAGLSGLDPDTIYYFVLKDDSGTSERYWFRTAPATPKPFSFIAGGDSRNNREPRQKANRLVGKLRPLFVAFTGDMINSDNTTEWNQWLDDWEETTSSDGRMTPLLPHRGNHENGGNSTLINLFNCPSNNYYALNFGGDLLRYYVLNSESGELTQKDWIEGDVNANDYTHLVAGYHKPMRPHVSSKSEGSSEYTAWADLFYAKRFDLIIESDSHTMKRTHPVRPSTDTGAVEGFITDLQTGTVYIGEGCWGAPLRTANDNKDWTAASGAFNGFDLIHVHLSHMEVFTVQVDYEAPVAALSEGDGLILPQQITLWQPASGTRLLVNRDAPIITSYAQYQLDAFGATLPTAAGGKLDDFDGDKISNFMEFAFGLDATTLSQKSPNFPEFALESGTKKLKHSSRSNTTAEFRYYLSQDLNSWDLLTEDVDYTRTSTPGAGTDEVEIELIGASAAHEKAFLRVDVVEQ